MMCFDELSHCVLPNCGRYDCMPAGRSLRDVGDFRLRQRYGIDIAEMDCRIDRIDRLRSGIRSDENEYLFLLMQKSGETRVLHNGTSELLTAGDCLLMDLTRPAEIRFEGRNAGFTSVHLPRALCLEGRAAAPAIGRRIAARHPLLAGLGNLLADADQADQDEAADYLFDFVGLLFRGEGPAAGFRDRAGRFRHACETIERHLTDPEFSIERLSVLVNMSRRQLQRDFGDHGTSFTQVLAQRRARLTASHLRRAAQTNRRPAISDLAFRAGFGDLSHFNRVFRQHYGMAPGEYYAACLPAPREH